MPPTPDLSFTSLDEFVNEPVVENCKAMSSKEEPKAVRKYDDAPSIEEWVSDDEEEDMSQPKTEKKIVRPSIVKKEFVKSKQQEKTTRKTIKQVEQHRKNTLGPRGNQINWNNMISQKLGSDFEMFNKACYVCGSFDHLQGNPQMDLQDQGVIDSRCSRHMTRNMSYLTDYEEIDGGYVAFGGNPKGGKITGKATKDETSGILKSFITRIENLVDHKVKVIRCDNGTEFKNKEMNQFCEMKGTQASDNADLKSSHDDGSKPSSNDEKKVDEDPRKDSECNDQENIELPDDPNMSALEDYNIFDFTRDDEDDGVEADMNNLDTTIQVSPIPTTRIHKDHPLDQVIRYLQSATQTRQMSKNLEEYGTLKGNSCIKGSKLDRGYAGRASTIQVTRSLDFSGFTKWEKGYGTKWVFRNKARLVAQGYIQEEWINYDEIEEEVYVCQPPGFKDPDFLDRVYKVEKALYGLHQLDDIIFGSTKKELCNAFEKLMHEKFQMSSMGELTFFLGLQVQQKKDGIFISQDKYVVEILNKFGFIEVKTVSTLMETQKPLLKDEDVCSYARYQVNTKVSHLHAVKRIFRPLSCNCCDNIVVVDSPGSLKAIPLALGFVLLRSARA
ncbi:putative ribonuclease H-like domain-containing protein [Tanacetum coccineum]